MSYFDDASLVMIPSGYKTSKVYSIKPTDASGDLDFVRSNDTATRVGPDGLIEKVRTNLVLQSQTFDNASWTETGINRTGTPPFVDQTIAPDGTTTADKLIEDTSTGQHNLRSSLISSSTNRHTFSVFAKKSDSDIFGIRMLGSGLFAEAIFDLDSGTLISTSGTGTPSASIVEYPNGWYRCVVTATPDQAVFSLRVALYDASYNVSYTGDGTSGVFIWGTQVESGDIATDYIATTTAAVSVGPVANVPRLDYLNSSCPRLLLEPQRTNLVTYSEQFNNSAWIKLDTSATANAGVSPDGYTNADKIVPITTNARHILFQSATASTVHTFSVFAKAAGQNFLTMRLDDDTPEVNVFFNLSTGTIGSTAGGSPTMTSYGNGWYRCSVTYTPSGTETIYAVLGSANVNGSIAYAGNGTDGILLYGAQLEAGSYATSYIPTLGAAVTRGEDAASKTGISSLIGQTEGTLFVDMEFEGYDNLAKWIAFLGTGGSSYIGFYTDTFSRFTAEVANAGVGQFNSTTFVFAVGQRYKLALAYKANDFAFYVNGTQVATDNSGTVPATSQFSFQFNTTANNLTARTYNQALVFKTRLSNSSLAELTSL